MSETYTIGGDTLILIDRDKRAGQTFRPQETHILEWVDLNLYITGFEARPLIGIYAAGTDHLPSGDCLSSNRFTFTPIAPPVGLRRVRFPMHPVKLEKDTYYCIIFTCYPVIFELGHRWQYDKDDATYPRGIRLYSTDGGETWTKYLNDDHLFAEFGTPPAPPPPPEPPILNIAILSITQNITEAGYLISIATNVPGHLFLFYTTRKPWKHTTPILRRGVIFKDAIRFCFVDWLQIEQQEAGDTLYHTFLLEPWERCQTRWFTFKSKVFDEWSPSIGPIFTKHRGEYVPPFTFILIEQWSQYAPPPTYISILTEPWTQYMTPPTYTLILTEPWTGWLTPPPMTLVLTEPWSEYAPPPTFAFVLTEPWTGWLIPPPMSLILTEPWSS